MAPPRGVVLTVLHPHRYILRRMPDGHLRLTPCLLRAIEEHKYLRSCECRREIDLAEAAREFHESYMERWHTAKLRADNARQVQEMQKHLWIESEKAGHDIGRSAAGTEWVSRFARTWRRERESLRGNDFLDLEVQVEPGTELRARGVVAVLDRLQGLSCDVYVSQQSLATPDFWLRPEPEAPELPFVHLRPGRDPAVYGFNHETGARLYFVTYGKQATQALDVIRAVSGIPQPVR